MRDQLEPLKLNHIDPELATDFALNAPDREPSEYTDEDIARRIRALRFMKHELEQIEQRFDRETERVLSAKDAATRTLKAEIAGLENLIAGWYRLQPPQRTKSMVFPDGTVRARASKAIVLDDTEAVLPSWAAAVTEKVALDKKAVKERVRDGRVTVNDDGRCVDSTGELLPFSQVTKTTHTVDTEPVE